MELLPESASFLRKGLPIGKAFRVQPICSICEVVLLLLTLTLVQHKPSDKVVGELRELHLLRHKDMHPLLLPYPLESLLPTLKHIEYQIASCCL